MSPKSNRGSVRLAREALTIEAEAQQVLNELLNEKLILFALNVGKITKDSGEYTIYFYDSRIHSARVPLTKGHSLRDLVRSAVLARVEKMSGPLKNQHKKGLS